MIDFTDREQLEIDLSLEYVDRFNHGTQGHNAYVLIAKLYRAYRAKVVGELSGTDEVEFTAVLRRGELGYCEWRDFVAGIENVFRNTAMTSLTCYSEDCIITGQGHRCYTRDFIKGIRTATAKTNEVGTCRFIVGEEVKL